MQVRIFIWEVRSLQEKPISVWKEKCLLILSVTSPIHSQSPYDTTIIINRPFSSLYSNVVHIERQRPSWLKPLAACNVQQLLCFIMRFPQGLSSPISSPMLMAVSFLSPVSIHTLMLAFLSRSIASGTPCSATRSHTSTHNLVETHSYVMEEQ